MIEITKVQQKKPPPAETVMLAQSPHRPTPVDTTDRDPLDLIAEEFAELCRAGKTPSVSDFVRRYPNHADDLKDLLPAMGQMESLKKLRQGPATTPMLESLPEQIGDYRLVREIGRGGMGIVFEAVQASLGRKVALKILPSAARADKDKRERFLREAQAAARLHHTNIVPVFGVGEDHGIPYYVMQYIRGCGLDDIIHGWRNGAEHHVIAPQDWRTIARLVAKAADALDYAHSEGVLHRDVKPGNLLLDASGHLWITDFGLAKLLDEATHTATGHVLGTFQYMAPEALTGKSDERTDVYGLGMSLYEMLTGRLPFDETNPAVLVKLIGEKEPPSPRMIEPKVPRSLETICLKAIAREPSRRYASAGEFADDLRAWLVGRPISARRLSPLDRGVLWCRRNPVIAGSAAAVVVTLAFATGFGWSSYAKEKKARLAETAALTKAELSLDSETRALAEQKKLSDQLEKALKDVTQSEQRFQGNLALSLETLGKILDIAAKNETLLGPPPGGPGPQPGEPGFGPDRPRLPNVPRPDPDRVEARERILTGNARMLEEILAFYDKFAQSNETEPKMKLDAARAYRRVAEIQFALGHPDKAEAAIRKAVKMLEELRAVFPDPRRIREELEIIRDQAERRRMRRP